MKRYRPAIVVALVVLALGLALSQVGAQPQTPLPSAGSTLQTGIEKPPCGFEVPTTPATPAAATSAQAATELKADGKLGVIGQTLDLTATLKLKADGKPVHAHTVRFRVDGAAVGTDKTDGKGVAKVSYKVPNQLGAKKIEVEFAGNQICAAAKDDATLGTFKASTKLTVALSANSPRLSEGGRFTVHGKIVRTSDQDGLDGREILASIGGKEIFKAATSPAGDFGFDYTVPAGFGSKPSKVELRFEGDPLYASTAADVAFTVLPPLKAVFLNWSGGGGTVGENATVTATLSTSKLWLPSNGIAGKSVRVSLTREDRSLIPLGTGITNGQGVAKVQFKIDAVPKVYDTQAAVDGESVEFYVEMPPTWGNRFSVYKAPVTLTVSGAGSAKAGDTLAVTVKVLRATDAAPVKSVDVYVQNLTKKTDDAGTVSINVPISADGGTGPRQITVRALTGLYTLGGSTTKAIQVMPKTN